MYEKNYEKTHDQSLSLDERLYNLYSSKAQFNISKLFESDLEVQQSPNL